jgi:hypothetical protein
MARKVSRRIGCPAQNLFNVERVVNASLHQIAAVLFHFFWRLAQSTSFSPCVDAVSEFTVLIFLRRELGKRLTGLTPLDG